MRSNEFHGNYTKHYYNGSERICSRLGDRTFSLSGNMAFSPQTQQRLGTRIMQADQQARAELLEVVEAGDIPIETPSVDITSLQPANPNANSHSHSNTSNDIFYYSTNHLGSTAFVTDNNATITQGFLYAPFGEITTEYAPLWQNGTLPKYAFNAKELDEETGMYYYEARYYKPPVFISRDPLFEQKPWLTPYHYCSNNPVGRVDPTGMLDGDPDDPPGGKTTTVPKIEINPVSQDNLKPRPIHSQLNPVSKSKRKNSFNWGGFVLTNKNGVGKYSAEKQTRRGDVKNRDVSHIPTFSATDGYSMREEIDDLRRKWSRNKDQSENTSMKKENTYEPRIPKGELFHSYKEPSKHGGAVGVGEKYYSSSDSIDKRRKAAANPEYKNTSVLPK